MRNNLAKKYRKIDNYVENYTRAQFDYKKIGHQWVSETLLYKIICSLFPKKKVDFHYRSKWLDGLELDIYVEDLRLGIEYMGKQHYKPIKIFGGVPALEKQKREIERKKGYVKKMVFLWSM